MNTKVKRAFASVDIHGLPPDARWMAAQSAVNSVLSKFGIKTKITFREDGPFLVVEGQRRRSPKPKVQAWESPASFSCRALGMTEMVHSIGSSHEFANKIVRDTKAGGRFYRGI